MNCIFCKIANREIDALTIHEDASTVAFLDIFPHAAGHTVVIPRAHRETLADLSEEELVTLVRAARNAEDLLERALHPDGFTVGINQGKAAGQAVPHLHVHILPRFENDGGGSVHSIVNAPSKEPLAELREKIVKSKQEKMVG